MAYRFDDFQNFNFQNFGKQRLEAVSTLYSSLGKSWQTIADDSAKYSKKSFEDGSALFEKLLGAKSFEDTLQIQSEYAKTFFEGLVEYVTKTSDLYANLAKEAFKPVETAVTKVQAFKD